MVAKSYQELEKLSEPYESNGKMYIKVRLKSGKEKEVRWYEEKEYSRMYNKVSTSSLDIVDVSQKDALGFTEGYITVLKGDTIPWIDWLKEHKGRFNPMFGWYFPSSQEVPKLPEGIKPVEIKWDLISKDNNQPLNIDETISRISDYLYPSNESMYIGEVGEEVTLDVTVQKCIPIEGNYGITYYHIFSTPDGKEATWATTARCWNVGETHHIKARVKDHKVYKSIKQCKAIMQTVLTRCREV